MFGLSAGAAAALGAGAATIGGALIGADAAGDASDVQAASTAKIAASLTCNARTAPRTVRPAPMRYSNSWPRFGSP